MRSPSASPGYRSTQSISRARGDNEVGKHSNRIKRLGENALALGIFGTLALAPVYLAIHLVIWGLR